MRESREKLEETDQNQNPTQPRGLGPGGHERRIPKSSLTRGLTNLACLLGPGGIWGPTRIGGHLESARGREGGVKIGDPQ